MFDKQNRKVAANDDGVNFFPVNDYLRYRRNSYANKIKTVLKLLQDLPAKCRPGFWFGTITVFETMKLNIKNKNEEAEDLTIRSGTIWFKGDSPNGFSNWEVTGKYINSQSGRGTRKCTSSPNEKPDKPYKTSFLMDMNKSGRGRSSIEVYIGEPEADRRVPIEFMIPAIEVKTSGKTTDTRESSCPDDSHSRTEPFDMGNNPLNAEKVPFKATYFAGEPAKLSGSELINFFPNAPPTESHLVLVICNLYKLLPVSKRPGK